MNESASAARMQLVSVRASKVDDLCRCIRELPVLVEARMRGQAAAWAAHSFDMSKNVTYAREATKYSTVDTSVEEVKLQAEIDALREEIRHIDQMLAYG